MPKRATRDDDDDDNQDEERSDPQNSTRAARVLRRRGRDDPPFDVAFSDFRSRVEAMLQSDESASDDGDDDSEFHNSDSDDEGRPSKKKKKKNDPKPCSFILSDTPAGGNRRSQFSLIDVSAEDSMQGPDPVASAVASSMQGNEVESDCIPDMAMIDFIETDVGAASSEDEDEDEDEADPQPALPIVQIPAEASVEELCEAYTEGLRTARMSGNMATEFTSWKCWYCRHREDMRQIPPDKRSTVMQSFGIAMDDYETATLETQAAILYQLWASVFLRGSIDGSRPAIEPEDVMTVERFFICLRDHIPPTERPMTAVAEVSRQLMLLLELTQNYWERNQVVMNPDGSTRVSTYLDYKAIAAHLAAAKQLTALVGTPQGKFRRHTASAKPVSPEETAAIFSSLRMCPVRRPPSRRGT